MAAPTESGTTARMGGSGAARTTPEYVSRISPEVQAFSHWTEPVGTLGAIVAEAKIRAEALESHRSELESALRGLAAGRIASAGRWSPGRGETSLAVERRDC